jgi:hypothetical protein
MPGVFFKLPFIATANFALFGWSLTQNPWQFAPKTTYTNPHIE